MEISELRNEPEMKDLIEMLNNVWPNRKKRISRAEEQIIQCVDQKERDCEWTYGDPSRRQNMDNGSPGKEQRNWKEGLSTPRIWWKA